jgi:hypothetical protein
MLASARTTMRFHLLILACLLLVAPWDGCKDSGSVNVEDTGVQGQIFLISKPGPIPIGWVPPPLEQVNTIRVLDDQRRIVREAATNEKGMFMILLQPGTYYLRVKESPIQVETGPYELTSGRILTVQAHFDNGMR